MISTSDLTHFNDCYEKYSKLVFSLAHHISLNQQLAEEVVQDTFLTFFEKYKEVKNPKYWLTKVAVNLSINIYNKSKRRSAIDVDLNQFKTQYITITTEISIKLELKEILEQLNPQQRSLLILKYGYNYKYSEMSEMLEIPEGTVKSIISRLSQDIENKREV